MRLISLHKGHQAYKRIVGKRHVCNRQSRKAGVANNSKTAVIVNIHIFFRVGMKTRQSLALLSLSAMLVVFAFVTLSDVALARPTEGAKPTPSAVHALTGKGLYDFNCASCHGKDLSGNGPVAKALKQTPPNLTLIARKNHGVFPRACVLGYIVGTQSATAHGTREMPVWGPNLRFYYPRYGLYVAELSEAERLRRIDAIINYIADKQTK